ncbi:hypothetical protein KO561_13015 [Radiobacillus kanasensis]|uniref:hypothetical protein n=1 Tax=Radiobacillus kanasensis TaxID=2844358 RepID=UPI001E32F700|nr:hypothetical protein [Radiobacillus kanasensis]UFT98123.1 hypothetical protein KO561_13015 [Radiobacillus kanasensis]
MKHDFYTSKDISPHDEWAQRNIVEGGLSICKVCKGAEGSLTTDCPGELIPYDLDQKVYKGEMDFIKDKGWVNNVSQHSPEYWRNLRSEGNGNDQN